MPVRQLRRRIDEADAQDLLRRLVSEWRNPDPNATQPVMLEEREGKERIQIFVIWDDWGDLPGIDRSESFTRHLCSDTDRMKHSM